MPKFSLSNLEKIRFWRNDTDLVGNAGFFLQYFPTIIIFRKPAEELFDDLLFERNDKDKDKVPKSPAKSVKSHSPQLSPKMRECSISPRIKIPPLSPRKEAKNEPSISPRAKDVDVSHKTKIKVGSFL